jgi:hypothetical protein
LWLNLDDFMKDEKFVMVGVESLMVADDVEEEEKENCVGEGSRIV